MGRVVHLLEQAPRRVLFSSFKVCDQLYSVDRIRVFSAFSWASGVSETSVWGRQHLQGTQVS